MTDTYVTCYFDGECLGNQDPDPRNREMRAAFIVGAYREIFDAGHPIPSSNVAEYMGLIQLLAYIHDHDVYFEGTGTRATHFTIRGDSQLVINQMLGAFRVKHPSLVPLNVSAREFVANLVHVHGLKIEFRWVPREINLAGKMLEATHHNKWVRRNFRKDVVRTMLVEEEEFPQATTEGDPL